MYKFWAIEVKDVDGVYAPSVVVPATEGDRTRCRPGPLFQHWFGADDGGVWHSGCPERAARLQSLERLR